MKTLKKILFILSPFERKRATVLLIMITISALLDMIGVASIFPFISVLSNPQIIETNLYLNEAYKKANLYGIKNEQEFLFLLGILFFVLLVTSILFKAFKTYFEIRFTSFLNYSIGKRLVTKYLQQPYNWFLNRNSADLGKTILSEVGFIVSKSVRPMINLISQSINVLAILALLIAVNPTATIVLSVTLAIVYGIIYKVNRNFLIKIGDERIKANEKTFIAINEAFNANKEIKLGALEKFYTKRFSEPAKILAQHNAKSAYLSQLPSFGLQAITYGGTLVLVLYLMKSSGTFLNALPIISLYAFAGMRLMPSFKMIYTSISNQQFSNAGLDHIRKEIADNDIKTINNDKVDQNLELNREITLSNICYTYPGSSHRALKDINLDIPSGSRIGLVGTTGSGKTTLVDIILGLLEVQKGILSVDGIMLSNNNLRSWQNSVGYVPQDIYLADDTLEANITFGIDPKDVDQDLVVRASKIANLHQFVINELPEKYQTLIGERGVRLSGGQRQRIGIARALYHNPQILILDEATSALDNLTEKGVMDGINSLSKNITIIIIAHRLSTVKNCDKIYILEKGEIKNEGTFQELGKINENFRINFNNS